MEEAKKNINLETYFIDNAREGWIALKSKDGKTGFATGLVEGVDHTRFHEGKPVYAIVDTESRRLIGVIDAETQELIGYNKRLKLL